MPEGKQNCVGEEGCKTGQTEEKGARPRAVGNKSTENVEPGEIGTAER